jgi:hypothetical protein
VGFAISDGVQTFSSLVDSFSNTWVQIGTEQVSATFTRQRTYYCANANGGASHTVTLTTTGSGPCSMWFLEVATTNGAGLVLDQQAQNTDTVSPFTSPSITTTVADELLVSMDMENSCSGLLNHAESTGFTVSVGDDVTDGDTLWPGQSATRVVSSIATYNSSWTVSGGGTSSGPRIWIASFSETAVLILSAQQQGINNPMIGRRYV